MNRYQIILALTILSINLITLKLQAEDQADAIAYSIASRLVQQGVPIQKCGEKARQIALRINRPELLPLIPKLVEIFSDPTIDIFFLYLKEKINREQQRQNQSGFVQR